MKSLINSVLEKFNLKIVKKSSSDLFFNNQIEIIKYEIAKKVDRDHLVDFFDVIPESKSQLSQDLFVLSSLCLKRTGFFVEFGATNGVDLSNTFLLETKFGWSGILAEPAKIWHSDLKKNRSSHIETDCVWKRSGDTLIFNEVNDSHHSGALSTIDAFSKSDSHQSTRKMGNKYDVNTISLFDLLKKYNAPKDIDYLSIDTEGSEFDILDAFDFDSYNIKLITCEHNYMPAREKIYDLLTRNGYERVFTEISLFDDWYIRR